MEVVGPRVRALQRQGIEDPDGLWAGAAAELPWFRRWDRVLDRDPPSFVSVLPKTRSGKIMRRVLRAVATGTEPGDISTIEQTLFSCCLLPRPHRGRGLGC
jgi:hypothetical protein